MRRPRELGRELAARKLALVYGGGRVGLMGEVASATLAAGGTVVGVIPHSLALKEIAQEDCTELIVVNTMHERKALMADRSDAFVALPGGYGTCDELFEILTWRNSAFTASPVAILNTNGFFTPLLAWLDHIVTEGLLKTKHRDLLTRGGHRARTCSRSSPRGRRPPRQRNGLPRRSGEVRLQRAATAVTVRPEHR